MRTFKYLFMGVLLAALFSAIPSVNATNYVKTTDLTADTAPVGADTIVFDDVDKGTTDKTTIANIFASAGNIGASTIVTVGALDSGSITSNFSNIDIGTSNYTSGGIWSIDVDGTAIGAAGSMNWGAGTDAGAYFDGTDMIISSTVDIVYSATGLDHIFKTGSGSTIVAIINNSGIDIITNDFTTGGQFVIDVDGSAIGAAGSITLGAGSDMGAYWDGSNAFISSTTDIHYSATGNDHIFLSNHVVVATIDETGADFEALNLTAGGIWSVDVDGGSGTAAVGAAGSLNFGAGTDFSIWFDGTDGFISSTTDLNFDAAGDDFIFSSSDVVVATIDETGIDIVTNNFTTGGQAVFDVDGTVINAAGSATFGAGNDAGNWFDGTDYFISSTTGVVFGVVEASDYNFFEVATETMRIDFSDVTSATSLMLWNRADNSLIRVTVGANDTGGTGFRALHIPNL